MFALAPPHVRVTRVGHITSAGPPGKCLDFGVAFMIPLRSVLCLLAASAASVLAAPAYQLAASQVSGSSASNSPAIRWVAVGIAAVLAILQGVISALTAQCSASRWWTVRFWVLRNEHIYWTVVVLFLCASVGLNITYIIQSGADESTSLLVTAATIGVVTYQYLITTWSQARFRRAWWLAWTGTHSSPLLPYSDIAQVVRVREFRIT